MEIENKVEEEVVVVEKEPKQIDDKCQTPKQVRHKRVAMLAGGKTPSLQVPASPLLKMLGYGSGVGVFVMERSPKPSGEFRSPWAIKKVQKMRNTSKTLFSERIEFEAEILKTLIHPNIIGYRGFTKGLDGQAVLAMEKAPRSLGDMIVERMENMSIIEGGDESMDEFSYIDPFPPQQILKVALDIGKAMEYLHKEAKLIHGDIKSANVLIFGDIELAKLCDLGVSKKIKEDGTIDGEYAGTEYWTPMEAVLRKNGDNKWPITAKADIYPFGLTIFEMLSLKPPHFPTVEDSFFDNSETEDSFFDNLLKESLGKRPALPDIEFDDSYNLILALFYCCTEEDPNSRPDSSDIVKLLSSPTD